MSELQKLRDAVEDVFKRISKRVGHRNILTHTKLSERELYPVREHIAEALKGLTLLAAEQEALSPAPNAFREKWDEFENLIEKSCQAKPKGSSVEYYKDRIRDAEQELIEAALDYVENYNRLGATPKRIMEAVENYQSTVKDKAL